MQKSKRLFPKLKAKGAAVRCILRFALELARRERADDRVIGVAQLMERFYEIIYSQSLIMAQDAIDRLEQTGTLLCNIYSGLASEAFSRRVKLWKLSTKLHLFAHLTEWQVPDTKLNPKGFWCYADEDLVGQLTEVATSCHVRTLCATAMAKWVFLTFGAKGRESKRG